MVGKDPGTGPLSREEFQSLVDAPFGKAVEVIRKFDPQFGRRPGEKYRWRVEAAAYMHGTAYVMAADESEAREEADNLSHADFDWYRTGWGHASVDDIEIETVVPDERKR